MDSAPKIPSQETAPAEDAERHPVSWMFALNLVVAAVLGYFITLGPAVWLHRKWAPSRPFIEAVYAPLEKACRLSPILEKVVLRWVNLWRPD